MKSPTAWSGNVAAEANRYSYDSPTDTYDSPTQNYDGVVPGNMSDNTKTPTEWTNA